MNKYNLQLIGDKSNIIIDKLYEVENNIEFITINIKSNEKIIFPKLVLKLYVPSIDIHYKWNPKIHMLKALNLDWFNNLHTTNAFTGAPVETLMTYNNENRFTIALSDTLNTIEFKSLVHEESAQYEYNITLFENSNIKRDSYSITLRIDTNKIPYYEALNNISRWWETLDNNTPAYVPPLAKQAMYSSWYSFHQNLNEEELLKQCKLSKKIGCNSIIIDDGWQTDDNNRGYAYCGDWEVATSKIKDMKQFVKKVHDEDMKILFWYSVPFIGNKSKAFNQFKDMLIDPINDRDWHVFDPRYKEVREYIIGIYEKALIEWDFDGFKLDFVDEFVVTPFSGNPNDDRRDFESIEEASDKLLKDCIYRLKSIKPDIMLEFRQTYNGPMMRTYGNIFRAVDCPLDDLENRIRICDIRLISGDSAVHSDMIMWNNYDTTQSAALQFVNILFSVPQISMLIDKLSNSHYNMLRFYCNLWNKYRDAFINGNFIPLNPHCRYNILCGYTNDTFVCTYHSNEIINLSKIYENMIFVNGTYDHNLNLTINTKKLNKYLTIYNYEGDIVFNDIITLYKGYNNISLSPGYVAEFKEISEINNN